MSDIQEQIGQEQIGQEQSRQEQIRQRAHELWEAAGRPHGADHDHWLQAETEIMGSSMKRKPAARIRAGAVKAKATAESGDTVLKAPTPRSRTRKAKPLA